ncbi:unnamed protein product [Meloidogyne enterolobii]|uniref:Uncharacterized protein n=1 Tax=Meloidogyne enterolobii TaxID=390850 RepID=A0ACB1AAE4_MELEN
MSVSKLLFLPRPTSKSKLRFQDVYFRPCFHSFSLLPYTQLSVRCPSANIPTI